MISTQTDDGGERGKCPRCGREVNPPESAELADCPCPSCGQLFWYLHVFSRLYVFDRDSMSAADWQEVVANVPHADDESIAVVEKVMFWEST